MNPSAAKGKTLSPEDMRDEAEEISREEGSVKRIPKFVLYMLAIVLAMLVILMIVPKYAIKLDPRPENIPTPTEVLVNMDIPQINTTGRNQGDLFIARILPIRSDIKLVADKIVSRSCRNSAGDSKVCFSKALFSFVRDSMLYIGDPPDEYLKTPEESLTTLGGDCDDHSILLSSLLTAVGVRTRLVFIPGHVYVEAYLPEALSKYKNTKGSDWVTLDATCDGCEFGETPLADQNEQKRYLYI